MGKYKLTHHIRVRIFARNTLYCSKYFLFELCKIRCIRQDFYKKTAHALAQEFGRVYAEYLKLRNMTKSAKGTVEEPGANIK